MCPLGLNRIDDASGSGNPISFKLASHVAWSDPHHRCAPYPLDLACVCKRIDIYAAAILNEPDRCGHWSPVSSISLQAYVFLIGQRCKFIITHAVSTLLLIG